MEDNQIIDLFFDRNDLAIVESKNKYGSFCHTLANRILNSYEDSEECVNDTWLRAWNAIPPERPSILRMYYAKITRHLAIDKLKSRLAKKRADGEDALDIDELSECLPDSNSVEDEIIAKDLQVVINNFVRELPEKEGDIFIRRYFFNETIEEISEGYDITKNNCMVSLSRTRSKLKAHLIKEGFVNE